MAMQQWGRRYLREAEELNITAFMNLMVILVPFLLITAVFSRMTVLELNLPGLDGVQADEPVTLSLELVLRENSFDIQGANLGLIRRFERSAEGTRWQDFSELLVEIKRRFPDERSITVLVEPSVTYDTLIAAMDRVRSAEVVHGLSVEEVELFPDIAIGDAAPGSVAQQAADGGRP